MAARIEDQENFSSLIQFGRVINQKKRVGMLLTLGSNVRLETAYNVPFLIGAKMDGKEEHFFCPTVGRIKV